MIAHRTRSFSTTVIHGDDGIETTADIAPPLHPTSTFLAGSATEFAEMASDPRHPRYYTRYGNPTNERVEAIIAQLEGAEDAILFGSGMGAISTAVLTLLSAGSHVVMQRNHYMGTSRLFSDLLPKFGVRATMVDQTDVDAFAEAIEPTTKLIVLETPANPTMQLTDLAAIANLAQSRGITTFADNTFASPLNQRPLAHGIDLVMHSGTKYLGGHHDLVAGVLAGTKKMIQDIWSVSIVLGATLGPFESWLLLRGIRTLPLRVRQHNETGMTVARALETNARVEAVHYAGLVSHPQHELAKRQMTGFGGTLSFQVAGGYRETERFMASLKLVKEAVSLGGFESLAVHAAAMWAGTLTDEQVRAAGVEPNLVRLSVGLEDAADIVADLEQALAAV